MYKRQYVDRVYEMDEAARSAQGRNIKNLLDLQPEEAIAALLRLERRVDEKGNDITFAEGSGNVVFATKDGTVKKTSPVSYTHLTGWLSCWIPPPPLSRNLKMMRTW